MEISRLVSILPFYLEFDKNSNRRMIFNALPEKISINLEPIPTFLLPLIKAISS